MIRATTILAAIIAGLVGVAGGDTSATGSESNDVITTDGNMTGDAIGWCGCDLVREGRIDLADFAMFSLNWLDIDCSHFNDWCHESDINHDEYVNFKDLHVIVDCWLDEDTLPPEPDRMLWDSSLDANGCDGRPQEIHKYPYGSFDYWATMRADPNTFDDTGFEFYFQCTDSGYTKVWPEGYSSGWISFPAGPPYIYSVEVGQSKLEHRFKVRARDTSINQNLTAWSTVEVTRWWACQ